MLNTKHNADCSIKQPSNLLLENQIRKLTLCRAFILLIKQCIALVDPKNQFINLIKKCIKRWIYKSNVSFFYRKKSEILKEKAQKDAERRLKKFEERSKRERDKQKKQFKKLEKECDIKRENYDSIVSKDFVR